MKDAFCGIIGHEKQCDYLRQILGSGQVAHAYCLAGLKGLGKATVAKRFTASLLGLEAEKLHTSPNVTFISNGEEKSISVEQIRELRSTLSLSTLGGGRKVAIIDNADTMTIGAQNALLKTLEEPSRETVIILIAHRPERLLETIRSRVALIAFRQLPIDKIQTELINRFNFSESRASFLAQLSLGRAGFALSCIDEELCKEREQDAQDALSFLISPLYKRIALLEKITKVKEGREHKVQNMIELWRMWLHFALLSCSGIGDQQYVQQLASKYDVRDLRNALSALSNSEEAIGRNVNVSLALCVFASAF
ncbi:DNA polymerase III subunit [Patescibacteria group bacterium]|nr:DNA polymerase III subunit [Patescibacteria group bacterium]MBU4453039.1 DNA polymerase III subunit [Patescibacteria group bacterium]MCG2687862.1 DNA polymerase III subunit [Candidatus Parcubacteria bacterium]